MRILHILNTSSFSGAENVVCQIIKMFEQSDIEMAYCSQDGEIRDVLQSLNIKFYPINEMSKCEINRVIDLYQPDIIHAHDMRASYYSSKNTKKVPVVSHIHNNAYDSRILSKKSVAFLFASLKIKHIFWVSSESLAQFYFSKFVRKKSSILYNVIDINSLYQKMSKDQNSYNYDVIFLGRLAEEKDPLRLIDVFEKVKKEIPEVRMAIVGDGALKNEMKELVLKKSLEGNVDFLGFKNNPLKILKDSKIMLMTSKREGMPMCALEAQILGTPIVSTPVGAMEKIIFDGINGFLCEDDHKLVESVCSIILSQKLRDSLSLNSIRIAKNINDVTAYKKKLFKTYDSIVNNF